MYYRIYVFINYRIYCYLLLLISMKHAILHCATLSHCNILSVYVWLCDVRWPRSVCLNHLSMTCNANREPRVVQSMWPGACWPGWCVLCITCLILLFWWLVQESWRACVSVVVGGSPEDEDLIRALALAAQQQLRKLFSLLTWDSTLAKVFLVWIKFFLY